MFGSSGRTSKGTHCLRGPITATYHKYKQFFTQSVCFGGRLQTKLVFVKSAAGRVPLFRWGSRAYGRTRQRCMSLSERTYGRAATTGIFSYLGNICTARVQNKRTKFVTAQRQPRFTAQFLCMTSRTMMPAAGCPHNIPASRPLPAAAKHSSLPALHQPCT